MNCNKLINPNKWKSVFVRTDPEVKKKLDKIANVTGDSINKIINKYIRQGLVQDMGAKKEIGQ